MFSLCSFCLEEKSFIFVIIANIFLQEEVEKIAGCEGLTPSSLQMHGTFNQYPWQQKKEKQRFYFVNRYFVCSREFSDQFILTNSPETQFIEMRKN